MAQRFPKLLLRTSLAVIALILSILLGANAFFHFHFTPEFALTPRFDFSSWFSDLSSHLPWVVCFALMTACIIPLRALQWRFTLGKDAPAFGHRYHAVAIGAFFHNAVPGKLGEFVRALFLSRKQAIPFFRSLGSVLVCKLLEFAAMLAVVAFALLGPSASLAPRLGKTALLALGICSLVVIGIALLSRQSTPWGLALQRRQFLRIGGWLAHLGEGFQAARSPQKAVLAFFASFGPVLASALAYGIALQALHVPHGIFAGGIVLGAICLGQLTPGLPVGTGMYYLTASWAARELGATAPQAATFAALTHIASGSTQVLVGVVSVLLHRVHPRDIWQARQKKPNTASL